MQKKLLCHINSFIECLITDKFVSDWQFLNPKYDKHIAYQMHSSKFF